LRIKICGITRIEDALMAGNLGAWAVGFIFAPSSSRRLSPEKAREISECIERHCPDLLRIGVFLDQSEEFISGVAGLCNLDSIQFHGKESPEFVKRFSGILKIKAFTVDGSLSFRDMISRINSYRDCIPLLDLPKDRDISQDILIDIATELRDSEINFIIAGGIDSTNICSFLKLNPFAIDISRGVEISPGIKDEVKMKELFSLVKGDDADV